MESFFTITVYKPAKKFNYLLTWVKGHILVICILLTILYHHLQPPQGNKSQLCQTQNVMN